MQLGSYRFLYFIVGWKAQILDKGWIESTFPPKAYLPIWSPPPRSLKYYIQVSEIRREILLWTQMIDESQLSHLLQDSPMYMDGVLLSAHSICDYGPNACWCSQFIWAVPASSLRTGSLLMSSHHGIGHGLAETEMRSWFSPGSRLVSHVISKLLLREAFIFPLHLLLGCPMPAPCCRAGVPTSLGAITSLGTIQGRSYF
jgi:hypothetical protein